MGASPSIQKHKSSIQNNQKSDDIEPKATESQKLPKITVFQSGSNGEVIIFLDQNLHDVGNIIDLSDWVELPVSPLQLKVMKYNNTSSLTDATSFTSLRNESEMHGHENEIPKIHSEFSSLSTHSTLRLDKYDPFFLAGKEKLKPLLYAPPVRVVSVSSSSDSNECRGTETPSIARKCNFCGSLLHVSHLRDYDEHVSHCSTMVELRNNFENIRKALLPVSPPHYR
jgi:hypothetical protein